jgi:3'(2'), 5'-bisphosphate nucleotidase
MDHRALQELSQAAADTMRAASTACLRYQGNHSVRHKEDRSPVTDADMASNAILCEWIDQHTPGEWPIISEERLGDKSADRSGYWWSIDPLDGTKEFIAGGDQFTVNVALLYGGTPVMGWLSVPKSDAHYTGVVGAGASRTVGVDTPEAIATRLVDPAGLIALVSKRHGDRIQLEQFLGTAPVKQTLTISSSLKFCKLATGAADIYARFGAINEWDIAAGHAILRAAGGAMRVAGNTEFASYGAIDHRAPAFVAWGDPAAADRWGS